MPTKAMDKKFDLDALLNVDDFLRKRMAIPSKNDSEAVQ